MELSRYVCGFRWDGCVNVRLVAPSAEVAAAHRQHRPGDVGRFVGREEQDRRALLFDRSVAVHQAGSFRLVDGLPARIATWAAVTMTHGYRIWRSPGWLKRPGTPEARRTVASFWKAQNCRWRSIHWGRSTTS